MSTGERARRETVSAPTTPKGRRTREHLLVTARSVFGEAGYVAARMSDVAARAGMSLGGLYRYFGSKEELFEALLGGLHEELFEASRGGGKRLAEDPYGVLWTANRGYLATYHANRDVMRAFIEAANVDDRFRAVWWRMRDRHIQRFLHAARAIDLDVPDLPLVVEAMCCLVEQSAFIWFAHGEHRDGEVAIDTATRITADAWHRALFVPA